ncbi:MAG: DUF2238 domain-containing protein [Gammaproteobacteria bacterium]|nr:DUF2238 domain-containing protein [Gammaproteobacteria bacterium]NIM73602.1 DUF2238 domain-containing protein [Gammaproteobacteria bacterium]NIN40256.1 DUF2238 domain-containing protein [Gammaproteobacteria bacterium]NIO25418.1 DUF2238 domain-containing protein [Gammaproteobacteria bacterium]NIO66096.1 DUF2238 domain-containing protein [Gammaproteobacteria bacterium]
MGERQPWWNDARLWLAPAAVVISIWSCFGNLDFWTWFFEILLGLIGIVVLLATYRRFRFTSVVYAVVIVHYFVLAIGARYTYAEVPIGDWVRDAFDLSRNHFDRVGHFMQGFTPALVGRELLLRTSGLTRGWWLRFLLVCVSLAISAFYELLEWWVAVVYYPEAGLEWLGHQGDPFDAQADMLMAMLGAMVALLALERVQDRQMKAAAQPSASSEPAGGH